MQFSTANCPQMNVSPEADAEFMRALEKEQPERYENLMKNVLRATRRQTQQNPVEQQRAFRKRQRQARAMRSRTAKSVAVAA